MYQQETSQLKRKCCICNNFFIFNGFLRFSIRRQSEDQCCTQRFCCCNASVAATLKGGESSFGSEIRRGEGGEPVEGNAWALPISLLT